MPNVGQDAPFVIFHARGIGLVLMIETEQMQDAVHRQVGVMVAQPLALFLGFLLDDGRADDDIAQHAPVFSPRRGS